MYHVVGQCFILWSKLKYRPSIDHQIALFGLTKMLINQLIDILEKVFCQGITQRLAKVLLNVWQKCYPTFGKSVTQRLAKVLPNVW